LHDGGGIWLSGEVVGLQNGFGLGGENKAALMQGVKQGFLSESVAGEEQGLLVLVPDGQGEHAAEVLEAVGAEFFVEMDDYFGVAEGFEAVAALFEIGAELFEIVAFAVVADPDGLIFVGHGLVAGLEVDDGEPVMS